MASIIQADQVPEATGTGYEGKGPEINLPVVDMPAVEQQPLKIVVRPSTDRATEQVPEDVAAPAEAAPLVQPAVTEETVNPNWPKIQEALSQGYSREEINSFLADTQGMSPEDADVQTIQSVQAKVKEAQSAGYDLDEVKQHLIQSNYDGSIIDSALATVDVPKPWKKFDYDPNSQKEEVMDIADLYSNVYSKYSTMGKQVVGIFNDETGREARREINQLNASIAAKMQEKGMDTFMNPTTGDLMYRDADGIAREVDSSFMNGLWNSKGEMSGAIAGGVGGAAMGTAVAPGIGTVVGGVAGSMAGAAAGRAADLALNSFRLKEDLEAKLYMTQMVQAGIFDGVVGVLGTGIVKGAVGLKRQTSKSIMRGYEMVLAGNPKGAYKALLENMLIDDNQAQQLVKNWESLNKKAAPGKTKEEKAIAVITTTKQGAEVFLQPSVAKDPKLANTIVGEVSARAKSLSAAIDSTGGQDVGKVMRDGLDAYQGDVKEFYDVIKKEGAYAVDGTDFRFDYDKLAIDPVMAAIGKKISDPRILERFTAYNMRIQNASADRTFSGLIDLRQAVNDFKYSTKKMNAVDSAAINGVLNRVDNQIAKAAKEYIPNSKDWMENFKTAKLEYAKMKILKKNVLYKALTKKGVTEDSIKTAIKGNIDALDGTFDEVLDKLPPATRVKAESAIIQAYTDKYTIGHVTDLQATHFPMLAEALKGVNIKTPEARRLVQTIDQMSRVFQNDIDLGQLSGKLTVPQNQSYLSTSVVTRAKMELASGMFKWVKHMIPSKQGNNLSLIKQTAKLLENPMNARTADEFIAGFPKESQAEMRSLVKNLQMQYGKQAEKPITDWKNMYKQSKSGKMVVSDGALGKGIYLSDRVAKADPTSQVIKHEVNMSRMATLKDIENITGKQMMEKDIRATPGIQDVLREKGYLGITLGERAMLFPEKVVGSTATKPLDKATREVLRYSDRVETAATAGGTARPDFIYTSGAEDNIAGLKDSLPHLNKFDVPKNAKVLDLDDPKIQKRIVKELFEGKHPEGKELTSDQIEWLMMDLHEGALNTRVPGTNKKLIAFMKKYGYVGHASGGDEAWLKDAKVLKDKK